MSHEKKIVSKEPIIPIKSENDKREYRLITLDNHLQVLLISDKETDKAAAGMDVNVGHFSDPDAVPGLAHFLEHMLFLGTKKFPDENSYNVYLNNHGGRSNAFTSMENTNYYFDVTHAFLEGALDRFAAFFTCPLFTVSSTEREMQAVHNENAKNLLSDSWKLFQLLKSSSNSKHPFSKFGTGNITTLRDRPKERGLDVRAELLKFHETYYSANMMKLAILGRETLDVLEGWARSKFSDIKNSEREAPKFGGDALAPENLQMIYRIVPTKDLRELHINWAFPPYYPYFRTKPTSIISHLLGHEGEGSILSLLKKKGWANALSAGPRYGTSSFSIMSCSIDLTEEGLNRIEEITLIIYQYIQLMKNALKISDTYKHIFQERQDIGNMNFRFKNTDHPINVVSSVSSNMQIYPPKDILSGGWLFSEFDLKIISEFISLLSVDKSRIHIISKTFQGKTNLSEEWYNTEYSIEPFSKQFIQMLTNPVENKDLFLPRPNEFIATDFTLRKPDSDTKETNLYPISLNFSDDNKNSNNKIESKEGKEMLVKCWHKLDQTFLRPKTNVQIEIVSPLAYDSPINLILTELYCKLLEDSLVEYAYDAEIAGLSYSLYSVQTGLSLSIRGYNHKLHILAQKILERMKTLIVKEERFSLIKEQVYRQMKNFEKEQPYQHGTYEQSAFLENQFWHNRECLAVINDITSDDLKHFFPRLLSQIEIQMLAHGNLTAQEAKDFANMVRKALGSHVLHPSQFPEQRIVKLIRGHSYILQMQGYNEEDKNSSTISYFQFGPESIESSVKLDVLAHLMSEPCFDQLRTKEQLGYLVWSGRQTMKGVLGFRIIAQSGDKPADYLEQRIEAFLSRYQETLKSLSNEIFQTNLAAVIAKKLEKDKTLGEETNRHWNEITRHRYTFNRVDLEVEALRKLQLKDIIDFFDNFIAISSPLRSKFTVQVFGKLFKVPEDGKFVDFHPKPTATTATTATTTDSTATTSADSTTTTSADSTATTADSTTTTTTTTSTDSTTTTAATTSNTDSSKSQNSVPPQDPSTIHRLRVLEYSKFKRNMDLFPHLV